MTFLTSPSDINGGAGNCCGSEYVLGSGVGCSVGGVGGVSIGVGVAPDPSSGLFYNVGSAAVGQTAPVSACLSSAASTTSFRTLKKSPETTTTTATTPISRRGSEGRKEGNGRVDREGEEEEEMEEEEEEERWKRDAVTELRETREFLGVVSVYLTSLLPLIVVKAAERNGLLLQLIPQVGFESKFDELWRQENNVSQILKCVPNPYMRVGPSSRPSLYLHLPPHPPSQPYPVSTDRLTVLRTTVGQLNKNPNESTGPIARPFARSFPPLTCLLALHLLLRPPAPLHSLVRSLAHFTHSQACRTEND